MQDLFCLPVNGVELAARIDAATEDQLLTVYQRNISDLFANAVKTLRGGEAEDFRISNAVEVRLFIAARSVRKLTLSCDRP